MRVQLPWIALTLLGAALFTGLGVWQLQRAEEKRTILAAHRDAGIEPLAGVDGGTPRYTRVQGSGRYTNRQVYLDNQVLNGRPGVHVFTPLRIDGQRLMLVNRGWLPLPSPRETLPRAPVPDGDVKVSGRLDRPPEVGIRLGEPRHLRRDQWPQLVTYLDLDRIENALQVPLLPWVLELSPDAPAGFEGRGGAPVNFGPDRHLAYAYTWFTMAATVLAVYVLVSRHKRATQTENPDAA